MQIYPEEFLLVSKGVSVETTETLLDPPLPIMLLVFPIIPPEIPIIFTHYSYFIPMSSPILFLLYSLNFCVSDNDFHSIFSS